VLPDVEKFRCLGKTIPIISNSKFRGPFFISPLERNVTPRGVVDESPEVPRGELSLQGVKLSPRRGDLLLALLFF
jgi:hypothetical protein